MPSPRNAERRWTISGLPKVAFLAAVLLAASFGAPLPAAGSGPSYYVSTSGSDGNAGTMSAPWRSIQKAADTVPAGATVYLRGGTYGPFIMRRSGTLSAPITFTEYSGETAVVDGKKATQYTIKIVGAQNIRVKNLTLRGGYANSYHGAGITAENSSNIEIRNNLIIDNKAWGVRSFNSTNVTIDNNEVTQNAVGIHIGRSGAGTKVTNNSVHHNNKMIVNTASIGYDDAGGEGIALVMTTGSVTVSGNRIWANRATSYDYGWDGGRSASTGPATGRSPTIRPGTTVRSWRPELMARKLRATTGASHATSTTGQQPSTAPLA